VTKEFLKSEHRRALAAEVTGNCREECTHCGMGCADGGTEALGRPAPPAAAGAPAPEPAAPQRPGGAPELTTRIRMRYTKTGRVRFLSHLDLMTLVHRAVVRAGVPVAYTQGFNPHPKIAFGPALSVGMESEAEYLDIETDPFIDLAKAAKDLGASLPEGMRIIEARVVPKKAPSLSGSISRYVYDISVPSPHQTDLAGLVAALLERPSVIVSREGKQKDIRPGIVSFIVKDGAVLEVTLEDSDKARPRVQDVIEQLFGIGSEQALLFGVRRTAAFANANGSWQEPFAVQ